MRQDRSNRLQQAMIEKGIDALLLLGNSNVTYATGATWPFCDSGRSHVERPVALVIAGDVHPHLFTPYRDRVADGLNGSDDHIHDAIYLDFDEGVDAFASTLAGLLPANRTLAVDDVTSAMRRKSQRLFNAWPPQGADQVLGAAKLLKSPDELACLRKGLRITEAAMAEAQAALVPGVRQTDLTARFLRRIFDLGADANILDPIWQVMPNHRADLPWTTHGELPCPLLSTERELVKGDVLWVDTGISYAGYHTDFGRTWVVGGKPSTRQKAQYEKWREINDAVLAEVRPGATGAQLTKAAREVCAGDSPWMPHFYIIHGLGIDSAEQPFIGTDLGEEFDGSIVLAPGMVFMLEPIVWDEGHSGYRSENMFVVTEEGFTLLSDYPYDPYGN